MDVDAQIEAYIAAQPEPRRSELEALHWRIVGLAPGAPRWFLDGKDETGKTVANPNIGYGTLIMTTAGGKTRDFYKVGLSANTTGISVYIMGIADKKYLAETYGLTLGKASVTGYCIKFRSLKDVDVAVLEQAILFGLGERPA
jgi:hypothetical protein